jgi:hypothetical protein
MTDFYLNEYSILAALLIDCKNFCGNRSHLWHFLRLTSPETESAFKSSLRKGTSGREERPGQSPLSSGKSKAIRKGEIQLCEQGAFPSVIQATHSSL